MKTSTHWSLLLLVIALACSRPIAGGMSPLEEAARDVEGGDDGAQELALAGFAAYLVHSKAPDAEALWKRALVEDDEDRWALYAASEAARRSLDTRGRALAAARICELEARHPLCAVAARVMLGSTGESPKLDRELEEKARAALAEGARGDAAFLLRLAIAAIRSNQDDTAGAQRVLAEAGAVSRATLLGPWSRFHALEFERAFPPESGQLGDGTGPLGPIRPREVQAPEGQFTLWAEPTAADVFYWATEVEVREAGLYHLRVRSQDSLQVFLDGARVVDRREFRGFAAQERVLAVRLQPGSHRLLVKQARGGDRGGFAIALPRADGKPAQLAFRAASGGPVPSTPPEVSEPADSYSTAAGLARALEREVGTGLAAFVAARDAADRDAQGAKLLAEELVAKNASAALLVLRGEVALADDSVPARISRGRAHRDFEEALRLDPKEASTLQRLSIHARGEGRNDEAAELLERVRQAAAPSSWRLLLTEMRLHLARGADSLAEDAARRALALEPGLCDALAARYDLARKADAVGDSDSLIAALAGCPGHRRRLADHRRMRGQLAEARALFAQLEAEQPMDPGAALNAAQLLVAEGKPREAAAIYERLSRAWPHQADFVKKQADALERAGDARAARGLREAALRLDGSDLRLRRALAVEDGHELLDDLKQDGEAMIARYRAAAPPEQAPATYILDASAVEAHPDGSFTERTHVVAKANDQRGVSALGEVRTPNGAVLLRARTLKKDGRVLEPEAIGGKEGLSLPGIEVGDLVEYEFLASTPARGPATPGFAAPRFFFRAADGQMFRSVYQVRAPTGTGLAVDPRNLEAPAVKSEGAWEKVEVEQTHVAPFVPEPHGPQAVELLPSVQVGTGAGTEEALTGIADFVLDRARPSPEVVRYAQEATAGRTGRAAVEALYERVMADVKGPDAGLTATAAATLAQGRGSRTALLKAALAAAGVPSRYVVIRPFAADPAAYRFPALELYTSTALRVSLPEGELWLDPSVRLAPFGALPPQAQGQQGAVLPEPGERLAWVKTPGDGAPDGKRVTLTLALAADGTLTGTGEERYVGFDAALVRAALERMNAEQRRQAIESSVARSFDGASLEALEFDETERAGAPVAIRFTFRAPGFARADGGQLQIARGIYPANLAQRFLALSERKTPLLIGYPERLELEAQLTLPPGYTLAGEPRSEKLETPFGRFERAETRNPAALLLRESLTLPMARIPPAQYSAFGDFVATVDKVQTHELTFGPAPTPTLP